MQAGDTPKDAARDASTAEPAGSDHYEIRVKGHLHARWAARFDGMNLTNRSDGTTTIDGPVVDQAALHGLLQRLRDVGVPLISVARTNPEGNGHEH
jgi:hypothetical protein